VGASESGWIYEGGGVVISCDQGRGRKCEKTSGVKLISTISTNRDPKKKVSGMSLTHLVSRRVGASESCLG